MTDEKDLTISIPGEWALKKAFGPVLDEIGEDINKLYSNGRNKIIAFGYKKIIDINDGKIANLRVTRDVFWNGSFTDEAICAEYFGGILASSRSANGKNDSGVYYTDLIKSLSSNQLKLHYLIYFSFNKFFILNPQKLNLNPGQASELQLENIFLSTNEITNIIKINDKDVITDLHAIYVKGLVGNFKLDYFKLKNNQMLPYLQVSPTPLGIQLYAIAHNRMDDWLNFSRMDFGIFDTIDTPKLQGNSIKNLLKNAGLDEVDQ